MISLLFYGFILPGIINAILIYIGIRLDMEEKEIIQLKVSDLLACLLILCLSFIGTLLLVSFLVSEYSDEIVLTIKKTKE